MKTDLSRRLFSVGEIYKILYQGLRSVSLMAKTKKSGELSEDFIERIMLAVTEVNGCEVCSYAHTRMALEAGMSIEEIQSMLAGDNTTVPDEQIEAIMFAQYYADSRGKPSQEAWERIVSGYGLSKSYGILGSIRVIMMGNAVGIPWSSLKNRLKGNPDKRSSLLYEFGTIFLVIFAIPIALLHAKMAKVMKKEIANFY